VRFEEQHLLPLDANVICDCAHSLLIGKHRFFARNAFAICIRDAFRATGARRKPLAYAVEAFHHR
jgi:hypothetical protein